MINTHSLTHENVITHYLGANPHLHSDEDYIELEEAFSAHNYHPIPVVLNRGDRVYVYDVHHKKYYDFLSAYSSVNQGHVHPRILKAFVGQATKLTLTSRAFHNDKLGMASKLMCEVFKYEKCLFMNSGAEGFESAFKIIRKWGYLKKKIPSNESVVIFAKNNFAGRTMGAVSASTDPECTSNYGPFLSGIALVDYGDIDSLEEVILHHGPQKIAGIYIEPIQGEAGVVCPPDNYFSQMRKLCDEHNILLCADEIQTGLGRTGELLCMNHYSVRPDMIVLGKALSGGFMPISAILADNEVMDVLSPGTHGSTYGGNPLACVTLMESIAVLLEEKMVENARVMGKLFREKLTRNLSNLPYVKEIRGKGLLNAIEIDPIQLSKYDNSLKVKSAWDICLLLKKEGLLAKPTHDDIIRFSPPLVITEAEMEIATDVICDVFKNLGQ